MTRVCEACGLRFEDAWTEEEARAEAAENYPGLDVNGGKNPSAVVCAVCYEIIRRMIAQ